MMNNMQKRMVGGIALMMVAMSANAQTPGAKQTAFEVAVIKPATVQMPGTPGVFIGLKVTAQQVTIGRIPLGKLIEIAYGVEPYQVEGPDWLRGSQDAEVFDVVANLPDGATPAQVPLMLQTLLADRFKLTIRKSSKAANTYALVVGKDGPKFPKKEAGPEVDGFSRLDIEVGRGGGQIGGAKLSQDPKSGSVLIEASNPGGLIAMLTSLLQPTPVMDKTGLQGTFDIKLQINMSDMRSMGPGPINQADMAQQQKDVVVAALDKIGLKLESQKGQVETIVIEHLEKTPTDN
ncbi:MAG: TIGR03435 family protein [Acidobacteriota bacterium]